MASHAGEINEGQVIIERIEAAVKIVTADASLSQKFT
jgi:hypothetical protein